MNSSVNYKLKYLNNKKLYNDYKQQDSYQDGGMDFFSSSSSKKTSDIKKLLIKIVENAYDNDKIDEMIQKKLDKKGEKDYDVKKYTYIREVLEIFTQIFDRIHKSGITEGLDAILQDLIAVQEAERKYVQSNFPLRHIFIEKYKFDLSHVSNKEILHEEDKQGTKTEGSKTEGSKTEGLNTETTNP